MLKIFPIPALRDNYIWMLLNVEDSTAYVVDPGEAAPVIAMLEAQSIKLAGILVTHHHWDHTQGIEALLDYSAAPIPVYGSESITAVSQPLRADEPLDLPPIDLSFNIMPIPGHTLDHIAYVSDHIVFSGDTLFTGGCGRIFEGTPRQMYHSLQQLAALDPATQVYCGHEYTQANLQFAEQVEPDNQVLKRRIKEVSAQRAAHQPTVPSTMVVELETNPFLRCQQPSVRAAASDYAKRSLTDPVEVLAVIRAWKNVY